jgi:hypothetical protein
MAEIEHDVLVQLLQSFHGEQTETNRLLRELLDRGIISEERVRGIVQEEMGQRWAAHAEMIEPVVEAPRTLAQDVIRGLLGVGLPVLGAFLVKTLMGPGAPTPEFPGMERFKS